jgi:hypothetical protein
MITVAKLLNVLREEGVNGFATRANTRLGVIPRRGTPTGKTCLRPFFYASVALDGHVYCCCSGWVKCSLGKLSKEAGIAALWNSRVARSYREAMLSTELDRVCKTDACPYILSGRLPSLTKGRLEFSDPSGAGVPSDILPADIVNDEDVRRSIEERRQDLHYLPKSLEIEADARCNLSCPSCRPALISRVSAREKDLLELVRANLESLGAGLKHLHVLGSGELFYSPFSLGLLRSLTRSAYPRLAVDIVTNGQLLTERMWRSLGDGASFIKEASVSIDAATRDTYEVVRRGGSWTNLLRNLAFLRTLRRTRAVTRTAASFVISARNYREMPAFVRLGEEYEMDEIVFAPLQPWSGMGLRYHQEAVHLVSHPEHQHFRHILDDPACRAPRVLLGVRV